MIFLRSFPVLFPLFISFSLFGQSVHTFQDGDWDNPSTWIGGVIPDIDSESIFIEHSVSIPNGINVQVDGVTISATGKLIVDTGGIFTIPNSPNAILVTGSLQANEGSQILGSNGSNITFSGSTEYVHNFTSTEGVIPLATWDSNATIRIQGYTNPTAFTSSNWGQPFGNFVWECPLQSGIINLNGLLNNQIQGSMLIENTGSSVLRLSSGESFQLSIGGNLEIKNSARLQCTLSGQAMLQIGGDFSFESTAVNGSRTNTTGKATIEVQGNFIMNAPGGSLNLGDGVGSGIGILRVSGNFSLINGTINESGSGLTRGRIEFVGNGQFDFVNQGSLSGSLEYYIGVNTDLSLLTYKVIGNANSSIEVDGTVRVGAIDPQGTIVAATGVGPGNIRVASRIFNNGSRVIYNGTSAQVIGSGHPTEDGVDMVVQNPNGVYFNSASNFSNLHIGGTLFLESGDLFIDSNPSARSIRLSGPLNANGHHLIFNGDQCDLTVDGNGFFGEVPVSGDQTFRNLTVNRSNENVAFDQNVIVTGTVSLGGGSLTFNENIAINQLAMTGGVLELNQNTIITSASTISGGVLSFEDITLTVQSQLDVNGGNLRSNVNSDLILNGTGLIGNLSFTPESWLRSLYLERLLGGVLGTIDYIRVTETVNLVNGVLQNNGVFELAEEAIITTSNISGVAGEPLTGGPYHVVYVGTANISPTGAELPAGEPITSLTVQTTNGASVQVGSDVEVLGDITVLNGGINFSGQSVICDNIQNEGTFVSGSGLLHVNGTVVNNGTFHAPITDGLFRLVGDFENNGTFNQVGGTIEFIGSSHFNGNVPDFRNIIITGELFAPTFFSVRGDFTNNGVFHNENGDITFSGTTITPQRINGNSLTTFHNLHISNIAAIPGVTVQTDQNISGVLSLADNVVFDADGTSDDAVFTLLSSSDNPTNDAAIDKLPATATILGDLTVQRYMTIEGSDNNRIYRYLSSPVSNTTVADIQDEIPITGNFIGSSLCTGCNATPSMFLYDETIISDTDGNGLINSNDGYASFPLLNTTEKLDPGRGYAVFVRGNILETPVWDVSGQINRGEIDFQVSFNSSGNIDNDGWNLVGNPFPSAINFNSETGWSKENIDAAIYFRDNGSIPGRVATWNGEAGTNGGSGIIATGQGFWVKANGEDPELKADENVKVAGVSGIFFREETIPNLLRIKLDPGSDADEAVVYFREGATDNFDSQFDAHKLKNSSANIATYFDIQKPLAINVMAPFQCEASISLLISEVDVGNHTLRIDNLESFPEDIEISVLDAYTNAWIDLRKYAEVDFIIDNNPKSVAFDRFMLLFKTHVEVPTLEVEKPVVCEGEPVKINIKGNENSIYSIVNGNGITVSDISSGNTTFEIGTQYLTVGENELYLSFSTGSCESDRKIPFEIEVEAVPVINDVIDGTTCLAGTVKMEAYSSGDFLRWYDCARCDIPIHISTLDFEVEISESKVFYVEPVSDAGCIGERIEVHAIVMDFDSAVITQYGDSLVSNYTEGNEWYLQGKLLGTLPYIVPSQSGQYSVQIQVGECLTTAAFDFEWNQKRFFAYPNPATNQLTISSKDIGKPFNITMMDILGKEVMYGDGINDLVLDLKHLSSGYYWLRISRINFTQTIVIQKK